MIIKGKSIKKQSMMEYNRCLALSNFSWLFIDMSLIIIGLCLHMFMNQIITVMNLFSITIALI